MLYGGVNRNLWGSGVVRGSAGELRPGGEATETSDIDIVVILNQLSAADIQKYNKMLDQLPNRELICGFLSGKEELLNWKASDPFQFCHDTIPIKGNVINLSDKLKFRLSALNSYITKV